METSNDYCVFVVSENNTIRWWRASDSFGEHKLWLDIRVQLPRHSAAASYFRTGEIADEPVEVDLKDWFGAMEDIESEYVLEQAIPLPEFDQVISMIWLP